MKCLISSFFLLLLFLTSPVLAKQNDSVQQQTLILQGRVIASDTRNVLRNASVTIEDGSVSTITNTDGRFRLVIPSAMQYSNLIIRYLGYENLRVSVENIIDNPNHDIYMFPSMINLSELYVVSGDGFNIVKESFDNITKNYSTNPNMMVAFYRETIKKNSNYISLVESVVDVYKASYKSFEVDQTKIFIGRKATDASQKDTVLMRLQGGINTALMLDLAKRPDIVFIGGLEEYSFHIEKMININDKPHYVISFEPKPHIEEVLFRGTLYIDAESKAISRGDFNMNVENRKDAVGIFIRRKPAKMKVEVVNAHYVVNFTESNGKWFFDYSGVSLSFRVRWLNRFFGLFRSTYTISSEMAITDRYESEVTKFSRKDRTRSTDVIAERVESFQDPKFWGDYNVIEPDIEISKAVEKLRGKLLRRN